MNTDRYRVVIDGVDTPYFRPDAPSTDRGYKYLCKYAVVDTQRRDALGRLAPVLETDDLLHAYQHADTLNGWGIWPVEVST